MKMWVKITIAIVAGAVSGLIFGPYTQVIQFVGDIFINLLRMLIVPLIFSSMVTGIAQIEPAKLGRLGARALLLYGLSTVAALILGLSIAGYFQLGAEMHLAPSCDYHAKELPKLADLFLAIVPKNPIQALVEANILQIVFFAVLFGICLNLIGEKGKVVLNFFSSVSAAMFRMTELVMYVTPYGVFALIAAATGKFGIEILWPVLKFLGCYYLGAIIYAATVYCGILRFLAKCPIKTFMKGMLEALVTGASTCSSSATLPVTIACATKNLGMSQRFANFILPFGCSLNLNGSALFQAMAALFMAHAYGIDLSMHHFIILIATVILATFGTASMPSGGLIMLSVVFSSVGIPLEGIGILASVDRIRDMASTMVNITGDTVTALYLAKTENELTGSPVTTTT